MKTVESLQEMQNLSAQWKRDGHTVALVPTMGFLHEGHVSLIHLARSRGEILVVTIFVNPTQFAPGEDLDAYPRDMERDKEICNQHSVDVLFCPNADDIYNTDHSAWVEETVLSQGLCGSSRPTHFRGVTTVVAKLFNIIQPDLAIFGEKDIQQLRIVQKMASDLNFPVEIVAGPTVRESDGLAMSSRNSNLSASHRTDARCLSKALQLASDMLDSGCHDAPTIQSQIRKLISGTRSAELDYIEIVDNSRLTPVKTIDGPVIVAIAVKLGTTRLIDNRILSPGS